MKYILFLLLFTLKVEAQKIERVFTMDQCYVFGPSNKFIEQMDRVVSLVFLDDQSVVYIYPGHVFKYTIVYTEVGKEHLKFKATDNEYGEDRVFNIEIDITSKCIKTKYDDCINFTLYQNYKLIL